MLCINLLYVSDAWNKLFFDNQYVVVYMTPRTKGKAVHWDHYLYKLITSRNKNVNVDNIRYIYLLYWYFQQHQCLSIKKHVVHKYTQISMGPLCSRGFWATAQCAHALRQYWVYWYILVHLYIYIHMVQGYVFNLVFLCAYAQLYWYFQRNQCLSIKKTCCTQICID